MNCLVSLEDNAKGEWSRDSMALGAMLEGIALEVHAVTKCTKTPMDS